EGRQALLHMVAQEDLLAAAIGDPAHWRRCLSWLGCGSAHSTEAGTEGFARPDPAKARELLRRAGYAGEKIVVLQPSDLPVVRDTTEVLIAGMRAAGLNIDVQVTDWATLTARRARKDPPDRGGWSLFASTAFGFRFSSPVTNFALPMPCDGGGFIGWACDEPMNDLLAAWAAETDTARRRAITERVQERAIATIPYLPLGQIFRPVAYRRNVSGIIEAPVPLFWNVTKGR
ncbi:MAG: ABC transporter substrate-binding protein, partial [Alphaproteobacteria bacterium]|nr:ABC transporter substrate-binding protein [Alphaproteobacteria bacterium]